jgi:hypothetical protein
MIWAVVPTCRGFTVPRQTVPVNWIIVHDRKEHPIYVGPGFPDTQLNHHIIAPDPWLFGQGSDSIRSAGFAHAYAHGKPGDIILTVDDDCQIPPDWAQRHADAMKAYQPRWSYTVPHLKTRGTSTQTNPVAISHGLWDGVPDVYAVDQQDDKYYRMPQGWHVIQAPFAQSSMNLGFRWEVTPVMYQPAQGPDTGFDRFADIWCGVIAQRLLARHWAFVNGAAVVYHQRASNRDVNLKKELPGLRCHEEFWTYVWYDYQPLSWEAPLIVQYEHMAAHISHFMHHAYFLELAQRMIKWLDHLKSLQRTSGASKSSTGTPSRTSSPDDAPILSISRDGRSS